MTPASAAKTARVRANLDIETAARKVGISAGYLRQVERGGAPVLLAQRLAKLYQCPMNHFIIGRRKASEVQAAEKSRKKKA